MEPPAVFPGKGLTPVGAAPVMPVAPAPLAASRPVAALALLAALALSGCATLRGGGPLPIGEGPVVLMAPHWDQVCRDRRQPSAITRVDQILELDGLERRLEAVTPDASRFGAEALIMAGAYPAAGASAGLPTEAAGGTAAAPDPFAYAPPGAIPDPDVVATRREVPPWVDVAVNYSASGALRTAHLLGHTLEPHEAEAVADGVIRAVRPMGRLLEPLMVRVRVVRTPELELRLLPALSCTPHITHEDLEPPRFAGGARVRGGRFVGSQAGEGTIGVRLHLSRTGALERIEVFGGNEALLPRVRASLAEVEFDPALLNGEPVPATMDLVFTFPVDLAEPAGPTGS